MRDMPFAINGVTVKPSSELVVNAAPRHFFEGERGHFDRMPPCLRIPADAGCFMEEEEQFGRSRKLRRMPKASVCRVEGSVHLLETLVEQSGVWFLARIDATFREAPEINCNLSGPVPDSLFVVLPSGGNLDEHTLKAGTAIGILRWKIGSAEEGFEIRR